MDCFLTVFKRKAGVYFSPKKVVWQNAQPAKFSIKKYVLPPTAVLRYNQARCKRKTK